MKSLPNILHLHSHDTGRYIQPYGYAVETPCLQRFAEQGVLFRQAFCASPTCSPSRAALLTGLSAQACGMQGLANPPWSYKLRDVTRLLPNVLRSEGYETIIGGVQHVTHKADVGQQGFTTQLNLDDIGEDVPDLHERAANYIQNAAANPDSPAWFMSVGFDQTHRDNHQGDPTSGQGFSQPQPYDVSALDARYTLPPATVPDLPTTRRDMASFREGVRRLDARIGHVLAKLDASGAANNTLVIVTTDHGIAWPGMKCNLSDHGLGVMLMLRGPGGFAGGKVIDEMVTHLDVFPTILDVAGLARRDWLEGKSLCPLVAGDVALLHEEIFAEEGWHEVSEAQRAVRTKRYKYIRRLDPIGPKKPNCDEGPTKLLVIEWGGFERDLGHELFFDLYLDPQEMCNRIADPSYQTIIAELRAKLTARLEHNGDSFLQGEAPPPPGLNKPA